MAGYDMSFSPELLASLKAQATQPKTITEPNYLSPAGQALFTNYSAVNNVTSPQYTAEGANQARDAINQVYDTQVKTIKDRLARQGLPFENSDELKTLERNRADALAKAGFQGQTQQFSADMAINQADFQRQQAQNQLELSKLKMGQSNQQPGMNLDFGASKRAAQGNQPSRGSAASGGGQSNARYDLSSRYYNVPNWQPGMPTGQDINKQFASAFGPTSESLAKQKQTNWQDAAAASRDFSSLYTPVNTGSASPLMSTDFSNFAGAVPSNSRYSPPQDFETRDFSNPDVWNT